jgi:hypothetical protein
VSPTWDNGGYLLTGTWTDRVIPRFVRGADPHNEMCLACGRHISQHYGRGHLIGEPPRCCPLPDATDPDPIKGTQR